jgi:hypothetical protein
MSAVALDQQMLAWQAGCDEGLHVLRGGIGHDAFNCTEGVLIVRLPGSLAGCIE